MDSLNLVDEDMNNTYFLKWEIIVIFEDLKGMGFKANKCWCKEFDNCLLIATYHPCLNIPSPPYPTLPHPTSPYPHPTPPYPSPSNLLADSFTTQEKNSKTRQVSQSL